MMNNSINRFVHTVAAVLITLFGAAGAQTPAPWGLNPADYRYDMSVYFDIDFEDPAIDAAVCEVAAFCDGQCRGVAEVLPLGDGKQCLSMRVRSNVPDGETILLMYRNAATGEVAPVYSASFDFVSDSRIGYPSAPWIITVPVIYDVAVSAGEGGIVSMAGGAVPGGTVITLEATADEGHRFVQWSDGNTDNPRQFTVEGDTELTAEFAKNSYTLTIYLNGEPYSTQSIEYGEPIELDEPEVPDGMVFTGWHSDIPYTMPACDVDVHGTYDQAQGIAAIRAYTPVTVVNALGQVLYRAVPWHQAAGTLAPGIYLINGRKLIVR